MSAGYAARLSEYRNKGICGLPENFDTKRKYQQSISKLVQLIQSSNHVVVLTGAGISTAAGIPDFRGPKGIWTVEQKQKKLQLKNKKKRTNRKRGHSTANTTNATSTETENCPNLNQESQQEYDRPPAKSMKPNTTTTMESQGSDSKELELDDEASAIPNKQQHDVERHNQTNNSTNSVDGITAADDDVAKTTKQPDEAAMTASNVTGTKSERGGTSTEQAVAQPEAEKDDAETKVKAEGEPPTQDEKAASTSATATSANGDIDATTTMGSTTDTTNNTTDEATTTVTNGANNNKADDSFCKAQPTYTHRALTLLASVGKVKFVITQNVDGLHRRSGLPRSHQAILHGCVFTEECKGCGAEHFRTYDVGGMGCQPTGRQCDKCDDGILHDTLLDWEGELPEYEFDRATTECENSDLVLCLGTSLRIEPAGSLPLLAKKFVIVNLQATKYDDDAYLIIRQKVDTVMSDLIHGLGYVDTDLAK